MNQKGSVSVVLAAVLAITMVLTMGVADLCRVLTARSQARTAADAAALAVAQELAAPTGADLAALADRYVSDNGGHLTGCTCEPGAFEVTVEAQVHAGNLFLYPGSPALTARARAVVDLPGDARSDQSGMS